MTALTVQAGNYAKLGWMALERRKGTHPLRALIDYCDLDAECLANILHCPPDKIKELLAGNFAGLDDKLIKSLAEFFEIQSEELFPHLRYRKIINQANEAGVNRLRRLRAYEGLSRIKLARRLGIGPRLVERLENGQLRHHEDTAALLQRYYGVSARDIIGGEPTTTHGRVGARDTGIRNSSVALVICLTCFTQMPSTGCCGYCSG